MVGLNSQAIWAAQLICSPTRYHNIAILVTDEVVVDELDPGDLNVVIATARTTESDLLEALLAELSTLKEKLR